MGYIRIDEYSYKIFFDSLLFAVEGGETQDGAGSANAAEALRPLFEFVAEERYVSGNPLSYSDWRKVVAVLGDKSVESVGRAELLRSLSVFEAPPREARLILADAIELLLFEESADIVWHAVRLSAHWSLHRGELVSALVGMLSRFDSYELDEIDETMVASTELFASLRPRVKQIEEVGVFLLDDYANTRALAAMWLSAIGRDAVHALRSITLYQASDFDDEGRDDIANALEAIRKNIGANEERPSRVVARQSAH